MEGPSRTWPALDVILSPQSVVLHAVLEEQVLLLLDDFAAVAVEPSPDNAGWRIFFDDEAARNAARQALRDGLREAQRVEAVDVEDEGWVHKVQQDLRAVRVGRIVVAPPWDVPPSAVRPDSEAGDEILIVIEPSTGFGTGHHQSTRLCLEALAAVPLEGRRVLDVGTGSGVLALAAARLGAREVIAIDDDPDAAAAAQENAARNGLEAFVSVQRADLAATALRDFDVVLANLTAWTLRSHRSALAGLVGPGGVLVASGFTRDQVRLVKESFDALKVETEQSEDDWVAITFRRRQ